MRKITPALLLALLAGCATQPGSGPADPQSQRQAQALLSEAIVNFRNGRISKATEAIEQSLKLDPTNAEAFSLRALTRQRLGQFDSATKDFQRAIEIEPNNPIIRNNFGTLLCAQKEFRAAEQNFLYAAELENNAEREIAYTNAGLCSRRAGDTEKARGYFEKAISMNPGQATALYQLAALSLDRGNAIESNIYLTQYRNHAPHNTKSLLLAARVEHAMGNIRGVEEFTGELQGRFPDSQELRQARQLIDPITRRLAVNPHFPASQSDTPPPTLSVPSDSTPGVTATPLGSDVIPRPQPMATLPTPALPAAQESTPTLTPLAAAPSIAIAPEVAPALTPPPVLIPPAPIATQVTAPAVPPFATPAADVTPAVTAMDVNPFPPKNGPFPVKDREWILQQNESHYALQLMAADDATLLDKLIAADVAPDLLARFDFDRHGKRWHNLVLGNYDSSQKAQAALNALPQELKALNPWIRPYGSLQRVIRGDAVVTEGNSTTAPAN